MFHGYRSTEATFYFVFFKNKQAQAEAPAEVIVIHRYPNDKYQINYSIPNIDHVISKEEIIDQFPVLGGIFDEVFEHHSHTEDEKVIYKVRSTHSITDLKSKDEQLLWIEVHRSGFVTDREWNQLDQDHVKKYIEVNRCDLPEEVLEQYPELAPRYWAQRRTALEILLDTNHTHSITAHMLYGRESVDLFFRKAELSVILFSLEHDVVPNTDTTIDEKQPDPYIQNLLDRRVEQEERAIMTNFIIPLKDTEDWENPDFKNPYFSVVHNYIIDTLEHLLHDSASLRAIMEYELKTGRRVVSFLMSEVEDLGSEHLHFGEMQYDRSSDFNPYLKSIEQLRYFIKRPGVDYNRTIGKYRIDVAVDYSNISGKNELSDNFVFTSFVRHAFRSKSFMLKYIPMIKEVAQLYHDNKDTYVSRTSSNDDDVDLEL